MANIKLDRDQNLLAQVEAVKVENIKKEMDGGEEYIAGEVTVLEGGCGWALKKAEVKGGGDR